MALVLIVNTKNICILLLINSSVNVCGELDNKVKSLRVNLKQAENSNGGVTNVYKSLVCLPLSPWLTHMWNISGNLRLGAERNNIFTKLEAFK